MPHTPPLAFHHIQDLAVRGGPHNVVARAVLAGETYEDRVLELGRHCPSLPGSDAEVAELVGKVADAFVALAAFDQALGLGVEAELRRRFEEPSAAELEGRAA